MFSAKAIGFDSSHRDIINNMISKSEKELFDSILQSKVKIKMKKAPLKPRNSIEFDRAKVSIIIPTYNRRDLLDTCIQSIHFQSYKNWEIIIVDDNSNDGTSPIIKKKYPDIRLLKNKVNKGPSFAKNWGALNAIGEYLLFLDSDSELIKPDSMRVMFNILKNKEIGTVGGEMNSVYPDIVFGQRFKNVQNGTLAYVLADKHSEPKECDFVPTSNCMIRRRVFYELGGFDPYFIYPGEDIDFGYRLTKRGYKNIVCFECGALHKFSEASRIPR